MRVKSSRNQKIITSFPPFSTKDADEFATTLRDYYDFSKNERLISLILSLAIAKKHVILPNCFFESADVGLVESVNETLSCLNTGYIDMLWAHAEDVFTPVEEVMRAEDDLVRAGKVLYLGISDFPAWIINQANTLAELNEWTAFAGIQIQYNLIEPTPERELLPMAKHLGLSVAVWSSLAGGTLTQLPHFRSKE